MFSPILRALLVISSTLSGLYLLLFLAWQLTASLGYSYPFWYQHYGIKSAIERFSPQNTLRRGFETTTTETHHALFQQIADSVHRGGQGLSDLVYTNSETDTTIPLLRAPEIAHLQDVALLISRLESIAWWAVGVFLISLLIIRWRAWQVSVRECLGLSALLALLLSAYVGMIGLKPAFHQLHEWLFTSGAPWFFYYQESLMSTLMYAPFLFYGIGMQIAFFSLLFIALILLPYSLYQRRKKQ